MKYILILIICFFVSSEVFAINPEQIVANADKYRGLDKSYSVVTEILYYKNSNLKSKQTLKVLIKDNSKSIVKFMRPAAMKGRVLLMTDDNVWIYIPRTKNPIRLTPQQRLLGQASNGDIARMNYKSDYNVKLLGTKKIKNKNCYHLLLTAKRKKTTYQKIEYFVQKKTYVPVKSVYFAKSGKILKEGYFSDLKNFLGKPKVSKLEIVDHLKKNERTVLKYSKMKNEKLPGQYFNKNYLKRIR